MEKSSFDLCFYLYFFFSFVFELLGYWMVKDYMEIYNNKILMINFFDFLMFYCELINYRIRYVNEILNFFEGFCIFCFGNFVFVDL